MKHPYCVAQAIAFLTPELVRGKEQGKTDSRRFLSVQEDILEYGIPVQSRSMPLQCEFDYLLNYFAPESINHVPLGMAIDLSALMFRVRGIVNPPRGYSVGHSSDTSHHS